MIPKSRLRNGGNHYEFWRESAGLQEEEMCIRDSLNDVLFNAQSEIIEEAAKREDCVIVGRCANYILRDKTDCRSVFIYAPMEERIKTCLLYTSRCV